MRALLLVYILGTLNPAPQSAFPELPKTGFVVDEGHLLTPEDHAAIVTLTDRLWEETQIPCYVVTLSSDAAAPVIDHGMEFYTQRLFHVWNLDSHPTKKAILFITCASNRATMVRFGDQWDRETFDPAIQSIIKGILLPYFRQEKLSKGITEGTRALDQLARGHQIKVEHSTRWRSISIYGALFIVIILLYFIDPIREMGNKFPRKPLE